MASSTLTFMLFLTLATLVLLYLSNQMSVCKRDALQVLDFMCIFANNDWKSHSRKSHSRLSKVFTVIKISSSVFEW
uniref:Uncharacterized protein n=1 Tax=Octopus bimaculoides TaxID=37653 RepID=A0A0L8IDG5_OCTBM